MLGIDGCEEVYSYIFFGTEMRKARTPNERLVCRWTESKWLADERMDLADLWYCKISV